MKRVGATPILLPCMFVLFGALGTAAQPGATLTVDADFPGGNIIVDKIEGDTVFLKPDLRDTEGWWFYWNFRVNGAAGRTLTFKFDGQNPIGVRGPAVSLDGGATWSWLGKPSENGNFNYSFREGSGEVRFSFAIPYLQSDLEKFLAAHKDSPGLRVENLCASGKERDVELLRAGRLDGDAPFRLLITARHHACESMGSYVLEGLFGQILAEDATGTWFRRNVEVAAVPFMDKDGVEDGDQGKNRRPRDHNRDYAGPSIHPEVAALRTFARNWTGGKSAIALDLHCPHIRGNRNEIVSLIGSQDEAMWEQQLSFAALLEQANKSPLVYRAGDSLPYGEAWNKASNYADSLSCSFWAETLPGIRLSAGFEIPYANAGGSEVTAESARSFGGSLALAIRDYLEACGKVEPVQTETAQPVNGVFPNLTVMAEGLGSTTEAGIGALMPWAGKLWAVGYVAHIRGQGLGLYEIGEDMTMRRHPASVTGTFANRMAHWPSGQAFIGPHAIDADGCVRTIHALKSHRLAATCAHLTDPKNKVYVLGMEGEFWEVDVLTLEVNFLFDLTKDLQLTGAPPHFKSACTAQGRVVVANNAYEENKLLDQGRLAEWDGSSWNIIESNPFVEVAANSTDAAYKPEILYAVGWDKSSVILRALVDGRWTRYLLPKSSQAWDHTWNTEWMRIRHAQTERLLMDVHGTFFELPPFALGGAIAGIRPICTHLRVVPDFCHWRGMFVMGSDQTDHDSGQPQSGFWFGNIDDLWKMGKATGWGGPWRDTQVYPGTFSDPYLMTGYDKKVLHITHDSDQPVSFEIQVDFLGDGHWVTYQEIEVAPDRHYGQHVFPDGFSAQWVRLKADKACQATAWFMYN